mmetsp:Transcript_19666/g.46172  ORF Transcript_19666/g.46172 Transcript_19666/m.46172 type:complete len:374 (+) Transcript_19666:189-1310(+)
MFKFHVQDSTAPLTPIEQGQDARDDCQSSPSTASRDSQGSGRTGKLGSRRRRSRAPSKNIEKRPYHSPSHVSPPHDKPMTKNDMYFALDCEMVGVGPEGLESALARVVMVNWAEEVVLDTFVKVAHVTDYRTFVSGITAEDLEGSRVMELADVRNLVRITLSGKILIGHALENDLKALNITHPWHDIRDSATYAPFMREILSDDKKLLRPRKLKELVQNNLGREIQELGKSHDPIEDARSALQLYKSERMAWEKAVMAQVATAQLQGGQAKIDVQPLTNRAASPEQIEFSPRHQHAYTPPYIGGPPALPSLRRHRMLATQVVTAPPTSGGYNVDTAGYPMYFRGRSAPSRMQGYHPQHLPPPATYYAPHHFTY